MLDLVSSHRSASSSGLSHMSDDSSTCVVTLLVTADTPTDPNPLSVRQKPPSSAASRPQPPSVHPPEAQARPSTRLCTKLTFVEIGNSTVPVQASPVRSVSAGQGVFAHHQLARSSTGMSVTSTWGRRNTSEDRPQGSFLRSGGGRGSAARGRQDKSQVRHEHLWFGLFVHRSVNLTLPVKPDAYVGAQN